MKNPLLLALLFSLSGLTFSQNYSSQNITFLSNWNDTSLKYATSPYGSRYAGVWGYAAAGKEYAIIGSHKGYHFIEVTNPTNPVERDFVAGRRDSCLWREIKTYGNYAYLISDDYGDNSFQIVDLSYLPDSVHLVHDDTTIFARCHTIWIDGNKLYGGLVKKNSGWNSGMAVYSLTNAAQPTLLRKIEDDYPTFGSCSHDMFVRNDTVYASCQYNGLEIFKFNSNNTFSQLASLTTYTANGYNHSSTLTPDGKTLIFCDEVPTGLPVKSLDVSDLGNLTIVDTFRSTVNSRATPHNPYVVGNNRLVIAYYEDGIQVFDISDPANAIRTGFFDTDTLNGANNNWPMGFHGCWGAYTDLPSGILLASDMQNGLYVLNASVALGKDEIKNPQKQFKLYPNPSSGNFTVELNSISSKNNSFTVYDLLGQAIAQDTFYGSKATINITHIPKGLYFLNVLCDGNNTSQKLVIE